MILAIRVTFLLPNIGSVCELYHSTRDPAWIALETLHYPCTSIRPIIADEIVWC